ncbi:dihydrofolate reductase family protein [Actinokineospora cianjurensis]|uniref:Dihydrofolate reductase n=1 Tax=Actinokineospora cianjurensis TaxID=585224 RepID=A0A421AYK9_9PSEU|nr:dihydrofolate reductase family protein [Actinokineospora cianjurensis]RLK54953.1 dihydrofolate reductase [Actinokineospora cianjurensis]
MSTVFCDITASLDGFTAGPNQRMDAPFGDGATGTLTRWMLEAAEENAVERARIVQAGAFIMGRNMFDPARGDWDLEWTGWWGAEPPYHAPVFVLTHHERADLELEGGTTFHFVTGGITEALERARAAAGDRPVAIAGGAATVNQYLAAGLIDELRLHVVPFVLGRGERLFTDVGQFGLTPVEVRHTALATHIRYTIGS